MKNLFIMLLAASAIFTTGCKEEKGCTDPMSVLYDEDAEKDDGSCVYAGTGGNSVIAAKVVHHSTPIISSATWPDTAFVKFNAKDAPAAGTGYDMIVIGEIGEDHIHITGLKRGYYWVQIAGFDSLIQQRVTGGLGIKVSNDNEEVNKTVFVTE
jgi:hypothetical protein